MLLLLFLFFFLHLLGPEFATTAACRQLFLVPYNFSVFRCSEKKRVQVQALLPGSNSPKSQPVSIIIIKANLKQNPTFTYQTDSLFFKIIL